MGESTRRGWATGHVEASLTKHREGCPSEGRGMVCSQSGVRGKPAGRNESERPMRHREQNPAVGTGRAGREGRAHSQVAKAGTSAGGCNRDKERRSLSGVKAVARRDRLVGKRTRASRVLAVARGKRNYKGKPEVLLGARLAVGGAHSTEDGKDSITLPEGRRPTSGSVLGVGGAA